MYFIRKVHVIEFESSRQINVSVWFSQIKSSVYFISKQAVKHSATHLDKISHYVEYSAGKKKRYYEYCFMKQKCQIQVGIAQHKDTATPLRIWGNFITHQHY